MCVYSRVFVSSQGLAVVSAINAFNNYLRTRFYLFSKSESPKSVTQKRDTDPHTSPRRCSVLDHLVLRRVGKGTLSNHS